MCDESGGCEVFSKMRHKTKHVPVDQKQSLQKKKNDWTDMKKLCYSLEGVRYSHETQFLLKKYFK